MELTLELSWLIRARGVWARRISVAQKKSALSRKVPIKQAQFLCRGICTDSPASGEANNDKIGFKLDYILLLMISGRAGFFNDLKVWPVNQLRGGVIGWV